MKKSILFAAAFLLFGSGTMMAQSPEKFNYQAVARDASGGILANQNVSVRISILESSASGTAVYTEEHSLTTNAFGQLSLQIGAGTNTSGSIGSIDWGGDMHFLKVEFDAAGGSSFTEFSTTQLVSVPYAMVANEAVNDMVDDADADPANEIQMISIVGDSIMLSNGGGSAMLPAVDFGDLTNIPAGLSDGDDDQQTLSLSGMDLSISNGNTVTLTDMDEQELTYSNDTLYISNGNYVLISTGGAVGGSNQEVLFNNNGTEDGSVLIYDATNEVFAINDSPDSDYRFYIYRDYGVYGANLTDIYVQRDGYSGATSGGTSWTVDAVDAGIKAYSYYGNAYSAAMAGYSYFDYDLSAAVIGGKYSGTIWGALGYQATGGSEYAGYFNGNVAYTGTIAQVSDARLKTNVQPLQDALSLVNGVEVKTYNYLPVDGMNLAAAMQYGFIAQQVQTVIPELVSADFPLLNEDDGKAKDGTDGSSADPYLTVNYMGMIPILTQAIQEQQALIEAMQAQIEAMQAQIQALEN